VERGIYLKEGNYTIKLEAIDEESGLNNCRYFVQSCSERGKYCGPYYSFIRNREIVPLTWKYYTGIVHEDAIEINMDAGKKEKGHRYWEEGEKSFYIYFKCQDNSGNKSYKPLKINTDFTPPRTEIK